MIVKRVVDVKEWDDDNENEGPYRYTVSVDVIAALWSSEMDATLIGSAQLDAEANLAVDAAGAGAAAAAVAPWEPLKYFYAGL